MRAPPCSEDPDEVFSADTIADPHPFYARLRKTKPIARIGDTGAHIVTSWALVEDALGREADFSANLTGLLMRGVVDSGTGVLAAVEGYAVAGKTGTAQKALPGRGYVDGKYTSLFAGMLPADEPAYLGLVVLDEVGSGPASGGYTAGQIYRDALTRVVAIEALPPVAAR